MKSTGTVIDNQITGESIPKGGIKDKMMLYVEHVCGERNFMKFVFNGLIFTFLKDFPTIVGSYIRPLVYKSIFGKVGNGCLLERSIRIEVPSGLFVGDRVFFGQNCWISPGSKEGEIRLGNDTFMAHTCTLRAEGGKILIGENVQISRNCYINGTGDIEIGNDTMLGPNSIVVSANHLYSQLDVPIRLQGIEKAKIHIEGDVWIGANVTVLPGVSIGKGTVVGAGAVVKENLPPYSIAVGVPAKVVGKRK